MAGRMKVPVEALQDPWLHIICDPDIAPPTRGEMPAIYGAGLPPGAFAEILNLRIGDGTFKFRGGCTASLATILAGGAYRGHKVGNFGGTKDTVFIAAASGGAVNVYKSTDLVTWTDITPDSGAYGDTRMADALVYMEIVPDPTNGNPNHLIVGNGSDYPRVYNGTKTVVHTPVTPPRALEDTPVQMVLSNHFIIGNSSETTITNPPGGNLACADATLTGGAAATDNVLRFSINSAGIVGTTPNVLVTFSTPMGGSGTPFGVYIGIDSSIQNFWDFFKVQLHTGSGDSTFFDPRDATYQKPIPVFVDQSQRTIWFFDTRAQYGTSGIGGIGSLTGFRLVYSPPASTSAAPPGNPTFDIFLFALAGGVPGDALFGISYAAETYLESPGIVLPGGSQMPRIVDGGGPSIDYGQATFPQRSDIFFDAKVPYRNTATAGLTGVSLINIYCRIRGLKNLYFRTQKTIAAYSGGWAFSSAGTDPYTLYETVTRVTQDDLNPKLAVPGGFHVPIPKGKGLCWANGHLFTGSNTNTFEAVAHSGRSNAFRFSSIADLEDEDGPGLVALDSETAVSFAAVPTSGLGTSVIFCFTDQGVWAFDGIYVSQLARPQKISPYGTISPYSVAELAGKLFYLDSTMQVRTLPGNQPISRNRVDTLFAGIPGGRRQYAVGCTWNERYYLAYTPSGQTTNTRIRVYEDTEDAWVGDDPPVDADALFDWFDSATQKHRLILAGVSSGNLASFEYDLESQALDLGSTNITATIVPKTLTQDNGNFLAVNRVGFICDDMPGNGTVSVDYEPGGGSRDSTVTLNVAAGSVARWDGSPTVSGGKGSDAKLTITVEGSAAKRIRKIMAEIKDRGPGLDVG